MSGLEYYRNESPKNPNSFTDDQHDFFATTEEFFRDLCINGSQLRQSKLLELYIFMHISIKGTWENLDKQNEAVLPKYLT